MAHTHEAQIEIQIEHESVTVGRHSLRDLLFFSPSLIPDERMHAQKGWFSCASLPELNHSKIIDRLADPHGEQRILMRFKVAGDNKRDILRSLWDMNISHETLFPGLDGFCQMLRRRVDLLKPDAEYWYRFKEGVLTRCSTGTGSAR